MPLAYVSFLTLACLTEQPNSEVSFTALVCFFFEPGLSRQFFFGCTVVKIVVKGFLPPVVTVYPSKRLAKVNVILVSVSPRGPERLSLR